MLGSPPQQARPNENLIGEVAPAFAALDQNGREIGTSALRGRVIVLNVWAPWCHPCIEELLRLEREIWRRFQPQLVVLGVALGEEPAKVRDFNRHTNLTFPLVADPNRKIASRFGVNGAIPQTLVINRAGGGVYHERSFRHLVSGVQRAIARR